MRIKGYRRRNEDSVTPDSGSLCDRGPLEKGYRETLERTAKAGEVRGEAERCTGHPLWSDVRLHSEGETTEKIIIVCVCVIFTVMVYYSVTSN